MTDIEDIYKELLDQNIVRILAKKKEIDLREAMDFYYKSKLASQID